MIGKVLSVLLNSILLQNDSNKNVVLLINADISKEAREQLITELTRASITKDKWVMALFTLIIVLFGINRFF